MTDISLPGFEHFCQNVDKRARAQIGEVTEGAINAQVHSLSVVPIETLSGFVVTKALIYSLATAQS